MTSSRALPPWSPPLAYVLAGGVGGCALVVSGFELYSLARNAGFSAPVSVALPVGLDLGAAAAAVLWVAGPDESAVSRTGRGTAWGLVLASAVLNGFSVLAEPARRWDGTVGLLPWQVLAGLAFLIAVSFPMVAAGMVHVVLVMRTAPVAASRVKGSVRGPAAAAPPPRAPEAKAAVPAAPHAVPDLPAVPHGPEEAGSEGTKQERAREFWRGEVLAGRREPTPAACNRHVGAVDDDGRSTGLVKGRHIAEWRDELEQERRPHLVENS